MVTIAQAKAARFAEAVAEHGHLIPAAGESFVWQDGTRSYPSTMVEVTFANECRVECVITQADSLGQAHTRTASILYSDIVRSA